MGSVILQGIEGWSSSLQDGLLVSIVDPKIRHSVEEQKNILVRTCTVTTS